jgi:uncharacterized protein YbaP (TraB family)
MRSLLTILLILLFHISNAQLLWEISGKKMKKPSFLYGTFHVRDERVFRFGDSVMIKFNSCKAYAGELDISNVGLGEQIRMAKLMLMPGDTTLDMLISQEEYKLVLKKAEEKLGDKAFIINKIKPIFTSALMTESTNKNTEKKSDSTDYLDQYLQKLAKSKKMQIIGIETVEEQMVALDRLALKDQAAMLLSTMKEEESGEQSMEVLYDAYIKQDLKKIEEIVEAAGMPDEFSQAVLKERNYVMANRISKFIKKKSTFIGIGVAHLPGKEGVIELLRKNGYTLRPVISTNTNSHQN